MLGNLAKKEDSRHKLDGATGIFYLSDQDVEILDGFADQGLEVFLDVYKRQGSIPITCFRKSLLGLFFVRRKPFF